MSESIKIGSGTAWAGEKRPTGPLKPEIPGDTPQASVRSPEPPQDVRPRSLNEIMAERGLGTPEPPPPDVPQGKRPVWIIAATVGTIVLALAAVASVLLRMQPDRGITTTLPTGVSTTTNAPTPTVAQNDSNIPLNQRFPASAGAFVATAIPGGVTQDDSGKKYTIVATKNGLNLVAYDDGTYGLQLADAKTDCIPNFWSPPVDWAMSDVAAKFESEVAPCTKDTHLSVIGYWKDTTWIFWAAPKKPNADIKNMDDWHFVWTDATWHGLDMRDVKAIDGIKDMYQPPTPTTAPQPTQAPFVPTATPPAPRCETDADIKYTTTIEVENAKGRILGTVTGRSCYSQEEADSKANALAQQMLAANGG